MGGLTVWAATKAHGFLAIAGLAAALLLTPPPVPAWAAGGGGGHDGGDGSAKSAGERPDRETRRPRDEADQVDGRYMQAAALWLPVVQGSRSRYQALTPRLVPAPDQRVMACFKAPWAHEALLIALHADPLTVERLTGLETSSFKAGLLEKVHDHVGMTGLYSDIILLSGIHQPDPGEFELSIMCQ